MNFTPENAAKVMRGEKTMTCRRVPDNRYEDGEYLPVRCRYEVGRTYAVCPGRGKKAIGRIVVLAIRRWERAMSAIHLPDLAWAEGFKSISEWQTEYERLNGEGSLEEPCYRIEFRLVERADIYFNPHSPRRESATRDSRSDAGEVGELSVVDAQKKRLPNS